MLELGVFLLLHLRHALRAPIVATLLRCLEKFLDRVSVPSLLPQQRLHLLKFTDKLIQRHAQGVAIGQQNIPPHLRRAGRDASRVTKSRGAQLCLLLRRLGIKYQIRQRDRNQMRQMTGATHQGIMNDRRCAK